MAINTKVTFTDSAAAFASTAAYGITQRVINSWNPFLIRTPRVLVPVQVDALVIRPNEVAQGWADCRYKPAPQDPNPTRYDILPDPFAELDGQRSPGVYLHWALPDALTHGNAEGDTAIFPAAPDRWLVLRMSPSGRFLARNQIGMRAVTGWVLLAGDKIPQAIDLDSFTEGGPSPDAINNPLTVASLGDVAWTAYYDNCINRLAFYDNLNGITQGPLSYLVCGWYSNPALDPLGDTKVKSLTDFNAKMQEFQWQLVTGELDESIHHARKYIIAARSFGLSSNIYNPTQQYNDALNANAEAVGYAVTDEPSSMPAFDDQGMAMGPYSTDGSWWPNATLMHGSVVAIGWPGLGWPGNETGLLSGEVGGPPAASAVNVAVGNTLTEALAALVAQNNSKPDEARILEGFLLSSLADLEQPDGRARLDVLLHSTAFASMDGGYTTETINIPAMPDTPPPLPNPVNPAPGVFASQAAQAANVQKSSFQSGKFRNNIIASQGTATVKYSEPLQTLRETEIISGTMASAINFIVPTITQQQIPAHTEEVRRALPRLFYPHEPVFLLEGASRTFKHGGDTRFSQDNTLAVRLTGFCTTELSCPAVQGIPGFDSPTQRHRATPDSVLERGIENGSIPPDCDDLLRECILLDPSAAVNLAQSALNPVAPFRTSATTGNTVQVAASSTTTATAAEITQVANRFMVEQTAWWATRDPRFDHGELIARSGISGTLPSPIAVTPPVRPWNPIHLDWQIEYIPSTNAVADWTLGEIDYSTDPTIAPPAPNPAPVTNTGTYTPVQQPPNSFILSGRAHLTGGAASTAAASLRQAIAQAQAAGGAGNLTPNKYIKFHSEFAQIALNAYSKMAEDIQVSITGGTPSHSTIDRSSLQDILDTLDGMDVLAGAADNLTRQMRGGNLPDGKSTPTSGPNPPVPFVPLRAGFLRVLRLRLVDGYGQFLDLAGSSDSLFINSLDFIESEPVQTPARPELLALPPRFTSPSRLWFRYMAADGTPVEADSSTSPVCGFLMPNHLDGDLEFFDPAGANLGFVRPDPQAGVIWDAAPGVPATVGQTPQRAIPNEFAAGIAQGLFLWGLADSTATGLGEDALSAILRIIDSTLWAVDPFGSSSDEHLSLLVGHPVAIMRAQVRLEVQEPIATDDLNTRSVSLRLGAITHWQDGLLGYFVNDDYTRFYCADAAVAQFARKVGPGQGFLDQASAADNYYQQFSDDIGDDPSKAKSPVDHPYVDTTGVMSIHPNQVVNLTLLVEPHCVVHATTGMLPRKEIGMRREWVASALAAISPTFRFGPVLVDPKTIRMPVPNEIHGTWSWDHRADITTWQEDPIVAATQDAHLRPDPATGTEGWMRMMPPPPPGNSKS